MAEEILSRGDIQRDAPLAERVRDQAEDLAADPNLQHDRPQPAPAQPKARPPATPIPGDIFLYLLLGTLAVCICLAAYHFYRTYAPNRRSWSNAAEPLPVASRMVAPSAESVPEPDEIERLARDGSYAEAIHLMLLRALETLRRRLGASWAKSLTSREIARRSELAGNDRQALKILVGAVEICRFGGQQANEQIYRACLEHYRLLGAAPDVSRA